MPYLIQINEAQRKALYQLLKSSDVGLSVDPLKKLGITDNDNTEPLMYWQEMLERLPSEEASSPNCIHGFCL